MAVKANLLLAPDHAQALPSTGWTTFYLHVCTVPNTAQS